MKVKLLVDCEGPNPKFDRHKAVGPDNPLDVTIPTGTIIEDDDAWMLCLPEPESGDVRAEPVDEEAKDLAEQAIARRESILEKRRKQVRSKRVAQSKMRRKR